MSAADNARLVRCLRAWLEDHTYCDCNFPDEEIGETGIMYCDPCSLRDTLGEPPSPKHAQRFGLSARLPGSAQRREA